MATQLELVVDGLRDEFVLAHPFDVLQHHVQHVLSHQVRVLWRVRIEDFVDEEHRL